ncbi:MAG TPA: hypothetical protein VHE83_10755 [Mycobacteriales bacterium]|nr:hypothetical protein [Mycobacteriales bacterium]
MLLAFLTPVVGTGAAAHADDAYFDAVASASGVDATVTPGNQALGVQAEAGALTAQAHLDALGASTAFASHPYPGQAVQGELGANDPFYVYSSYPDHVHGAQSLPVSTLSASSDATSSEATASGTPAIPGLAVGATSAASKVVHGADGSVSAVSDTDVQGIGVANVLTIADVHAHAEVKRDAAGKISRTATFTFGSAAVGGVPVAISSDGVILAGTTVPLPLPEQPVDQALSAAGVTIHEIAGITTTDSATAPALAITFVGDVPDVGHVDASFLLGVAHAEITGTPSNGASAAAPSPSPPPSTRPSTGGPTSLSPGSAAPPGESPRAPAVPGTIDAGPLASEPPVVAPPPGNGGATVLVSSGRRMAREPVSWISLYVIAIAACLLALGGGSLVRHLGVRAR